MNKKFVKILSLILTGTMLLTGCTTKYTPAQPTPDEGKIGIEKSKLESDDGKNTETVTNYVKLGANQMTIAELKQRYGSTDTTQTVNIKPFYNVEQTTQFTFHFNSNVEPAFAITVHTDPSCNDDSMVYQINSGYLSDKGGVDVVVKPGSPVLRSEARYIDNYNWGFAPIYYMCIHYDMTTTEVTKLQNPIIVPFTVKSDVSVPTVLAEISSDGVFGLKWNSVKGAVSYNIYRANRVRSNSPAYNESRSKYGYVGDHLEKVATVTDTYFSDFHLDGTDNMQIGSDGYVVTENFYDLGSYYVTAVDASGNESFYSFPITGWQYYSQLPRRFDDLKGFVRNNLQIVQLPQSVPVLFCDGSTKYMPITYNRLEEAYDSYYYEYHIIGTKLSGRVKYTSASGDYPSYIGSSSDIPTGMYSVNNNILIVPTNDIDTLRNYSNSVDLSKTVSFDESRKIEYDSDVLYKRADIENARIITDGAYEGRLDQITSYVSDSRYKVGGTSNATPIVETKPEPEEKGDDGKIGGGNSLEDIFGEEPTQEEKGDDGKIGGGNSLEDIFGEEPTQEEKPSVPSGDELTSDNLVEENIKETEEEVREAEKEVIEDKGYPIFASSEEEAYLAFMMINTIEAFPVTAFPRLMDGNYFMDVFFKVLCQNPYVQGVNEVALDYENGVVYVKYILSREENARQQEEIAAKAESILNSIIKDNMTEEEKINAIWLYLENNTSYDMGALEALEKTDFVMTPENYNYTYAFDTYGIMCKNLGVCSSYAHTFKLLCEGAGIECLRLTGYLNQTLAHAWNAVNLGGTWYWLDATNNENVTGIPYMLYQTSSQTAVASSYTLDDDFDLDTNLRYILSDDNSKDWYYVNGFVASSDRELQSKIVDMYMTTNKNILILKLNYNFMESEQFYINVIQDLIQKGVQREQLEKMGGGVSGCYFLLIRDMTEYMEQ